MAFEDHKEMAEVKLIALGKILVGDKVLTKKEFDEYVELADRFVYQELREILGEELSELMGVNDVPKN